MMLLLFFFSHSRDLYIHRRDHRLSVDFRTVKEWIKTHLGEDAIASHMVAVSSNKALVQSFGIDPSNVFTFWDWVGGRYSVSSAVGILPLSVQYGFDTSKKYARNKSVSESYMIPWC